MKTININLIHILPEEENGIEILYNIYDSLYGKSLIASTEKGICYIAFGEEEVMEIELKEKYRKANFTKRSVDLHQRAINAFSNIKKEGALPLHVKGTDFQLKVWNALLHIPRGKTSTYKAIAEQIGHPKATRAVGTAVGQNPVSYFIPCHRIIRTDGTLGGYHWGIELKKQMLFNESK